MTTYIALLRGINVGGHNKMKMAELKQLLETMGLKRVQTYIQSGNVIFESEEKPSQLSERIEEGIKNTFGISTFVILRTALEFEEITKKCPYSEETFSEGESLSIAFLAESLSEEGKSSLEKFNQDIDEYFSEGKEIYLYLRQSIRNSKLAIQIQKLGIPVTIRNWKTTTKLVALSKK
ncbi:MAG: DUF1697 domain-containing protein [Bacillota bacterium]|nr:DUF1697 domain-containing protein [Bacillota bacterium]